MTIDSALIDVRYAMRQLREFSDVGRALDALERVEEVLEELEKLSQDVPDVYIPDLPGGPAVALPDHVVFFRNTDPPY